jgi:hypothetical protein
MNVPNGNNNNSNSSILPFVTAAAMQSMQNLNNNNNNNNAGNSNNQELMTQLLLAVLAQLFSSQDASSAPAAQQMVALLLAIHASQNQGSRKEHEEPQQGMNSCQKLPQQHEIGQLMATLLAQKVSTQDIPKETSPKPTAIQESGQPSSSMPSPLPRTNTSQMPPQLAWLLAGSQKSQMGTSNVSQGNNAIPFPSHSSGSQQGQRMQETSSTQLHCQRPVGYAPLSQRGLSQSHQQPTQNSRNEGVMHSMTNTNAGQQQQLAAAQMQQFVVAMAAQGQQVTPEMQQQLMSMMAMQGKQDFQQPHSSGSLFGSNDVTQQQAQHQQTDPTTDIANNRSQNNAHQQQNSLHRIGLMPPTAQKSAANSNVQQQFVVQSNQPSQQKSPGGFVSSMVNLEQQMPSQIAAQMKQLAAKSLYQGRQHQVQNKEQLPHQQMQQQLHSAPSGSLNRINNFVVAQPQVLTPQQQLLAAQLMQMQHLMP